MVITIFSIWIRLDTYADNHFEMRQRGVASTSCSKRESRPFCILLAHKKIYFDIILTYFLN